MVRIQKFWEFGEGGGMGTMCRDIAEMAVLWWNWGVGKAGQWRNDGDMVVLGQWGGGGMVITICNILGRI